MAGVRKEGRLSRERIFIVATRGGGGGVRKMSCHKGSIMTRVIRVSWRNAIMFVELALCIYVGSVRVGEDEWFWSPYIYYSPSNEQRITTVVLSSLLPLFPLLSPSTLSYVSIEKEMYSTYLTYLFLAKCKNNWYLPSWLPYVLVFISQTISSALNFIKFCIAFKCRILLPLSHHPLRRCFAR